MLRTLLALLSAMLLSGCSSCDPASPETVTILTILDIQSAQRHYMRHHGRVASLEEVTDLTRSLQREIAGSTYDFAIQPRATGYQLRARPRRFGPDGRRGFYTDETGIIRERWDNLEPGPTDREFK